MVLLTSSTVSVIVSSSVVCMFTFLLFLSGYVLQQQSLRSIQDALRRPPEPIPVPTLPPQFRDIENDTAGVVVEYTHDGTEVVIGNDGRVEEMLQVPVVASAGRKEAQPQRLGYIFALEEPQQLCSALLFAKEHRSTSRLSKEPLIVLLYPSTWESDSSAIYASALGFMRDVQELYNVVYRPVQIHNAWNTRALLLGELQWGRWDFDQALYLRLPGMVLNTQTLDSVLASSDTRQLWAPLNPSSGDNPEVMLRTPKGLQSPRGQARKTILSEHQEALEPEETENRVKELNDQAGYVLFDDRDDESEVEWYNDRKDKFNKNVGMICAGTGLLENRPS